MVRPEGAAKIEKFSAKICVRLCLEGGYRVLSEPVHYLSDVRPAARELWHSRPPIGLIELGIHNAFGLSAMRTRDGRGSCDAYCVAKYGVKWFRTQTVIDSLAPRFHRGRGWRPWKVGRWRRQGRLRAGSRRLVDAEKAAAPDGGGGACGGGAGTERALGSDG